MGEGGFNESQSQWIKFTFLDYAPLRLLWQKHLLNFISTEFGELNGLVDELWREYPKVSMLIQVIIKKSQQKITKGYCDI